MKDDDREPLQAPRGLEGAGARRVARRRASRASRSCRIRRRCRRRRPSTSLARRAPRPARRVGGLGRALRGADRGGRHASSPARRTRLEPAAREGETGIFRLTHRKPAGREPRLHGPRPPDASRPRAPQRHGSRALVGRREPRGEALHSGFVTCCREPTRGPPESSFIPRRFPARSASATSGPWVDRFLDWAARRARRSGRCCPSTPIGGGGSPYGGASAFAGNPL